MKKTKIQFQSGFQLFIYSKLDNGFESKLKRIQRWFQLLHRNKFGLVVIVIPKQSEKDKAYQNWHQLAIEAGVRLVTVTISSLENRSPSYRYKVNQEIEKNLIRGNGIIIHDSNDIELVEWLLASKPDNDTSAKPRLRRFIKLPQKSTIKASFKILVVGLALTFVSHILRNQKEDNNYQLLQIAANTIDSDLIELNRNLKSTNEINHLYERKPYLASIATFSKISNRMNLETVSFSRSLATDLQLKNSDLVYWLNTIPELSEPSPELPVYRIVTYNKNYTVLLVSIWNDPGDRIQLLAISPEVLLKSYQSRSLHSFVLIDGRSGFYPIDLIIPISYLLPFLESNTGVGSTEIRTIHSIFDISFYILPKTGLALFLIQDNTDTMIRLSRFNLNDILIFIVFVLPTGLLITRRFNLLTFFKNQSRLLLIVHSLVAILWCSSVVILALNIRVIKPKNEIQVGYVSRIMEHRNNDELTWSIVQPNQFLDESEWLRTDAKGEAIITIDDGATIELDPNSLISLPSSAQNFISVFQGSVLITAGNDDAM
ncbi:MAG: hypothetical protein H3C43_08050, partial [Leptonema sp. (in: Bacteria)]|nr:hypothetical protein [Leptonema sp. (in: bacteria)]